MKKGTLASFGIKLSVFLMTAFLTSTSVISVTRLTAGPELTVYTDQPQYYPGEQVTVYGQLTDNGTGVPSSPQCIDVYDSAGNSILGLCGITNDQGNYTFPVLLENDALLGVYLVSVHSIVYDIRVNTTFEVVSTNITVEATGPGSGNTGSPIVFFGSATGGKIPYNWSWNFGDNTTSYQQNTTHIYTQPGNYTVVLTVTDKGGYHGNDSMEINISPAQNHPPNKPTITGPTIGKVGKNNDFIVSAVDPDGDNISSYKIDMGDNNIIVLLGPYASGANVSFSYTWQQRGTYTVKAKAKDVHDSESNWSAPLVITIAGPVLNITMKNGIGLVFDIQNIGDADATNVTLNVSLKGGFILRPKGGHVEFTIAILHPQEHAVEKILVIGLGKAILTIQLKADGIPPVEKQVNVLVLGVFVIIQS
jgi:PKD repeat protein